MVKKEKTFRSPDIELSPGAAMGIEGQLLLFPFVLMIAKLVLVAGLGAIQLFHQEDDRIMMHPQHPHAIHSCKKSRIFRTQPLAFI